MFTGIVTDVGQVVAIAQGKHLMNMKARLAVFGGGHGRQVPMVIALEPAGEEFADGFIEQVADGGGKNSVIALEVVVVLVEAAQSARDVGGD